MTSPEWAQDDDALMSHIRDALVYDNEVTDRMRQAAKAAFSWRTVDLELELMTMLADSELEGSLGVRGQAPTAARSLTFAGPTLNVEVEIGDTTIMGQLYPVAAANVAPANVAAATVRVTTAAGVTAETATDDVGFFVLDRPAAGPIRLSCATADSQAVTEWISLL